MKQKAISQTSVWWQTECCHRFINEIKI